jgi:hypothetical protein
LWQDAFDQFEISFGHTTEDHLFRRHADFAKIRKRQNFKVDIPKDTPNGTITGTFDLSSAVIDTVFPAESFLAGIQDIVPIPDLPIEIGCKNCSTRGRLTLNQGAIKIDLSQIDLIPDIFQGGDDGKQIANLVSGGFIELVATGVGARIELFARPKKSGSFEVALFPIPASDKLEQVSSRGSLQTLRLPVGVLNSHMVSMLQYVFSRESTEPC